MPWAKLVMQMGRLTASAVYRLVTDTSGFQRHHYRGSRVGAAPVDDAARICDHSNMEVQMRRTYRNAEKILGEFGATLNDVVEAVLSVTDLEKAFAAAGSVRREAYWSTKPVVSSTILVTPRLALPTQLIQTKLIAKLD